MIIYACGFFYISIASFWENFQEMRAKRQLALAASLVSSAGKIQ
jgi:hypothetical protein